MVQMPSTALHAARWAKLSCPTLRRRPSQRGRGSACPQGDQALHKMLEVVVRAPPDLCGQNAQAVRTPSSKLGVTGELPALCRQQFPLEYAVQNMTPSTLDQRQKIQGRADSSLFYLLDRSLWCRGTYPANTMRVRSGRGSSCRAVFWMTHGFLSLGLWFCFPFGWADAVTLGSTNPELRVMTLRVSQGDKFIDKSPDRRLTPVPCTRADLVAAAREAASQAIPAADRASRDKGDTNMASQHAFPQGVTP